MALIILPFLTRTVDGYLFFSMVRSNAVMSNKLRKLNKLKSKNKRGSSSELLLLMMMMMQLTSNLCCLCCSSPGSNRDSRSDHTGPHWLANSDRLAERVAEAVCLSACIPSIATIHPSKSIIIERIPFGLAAVAVHCLLNRLTAARPGHGHSFTPSLPITSLNLCLTGL